MSPSGLWPALGYTGSLIDRAAQHRSSEEAMRRLEADPRARWYVLSNDLVLMRRNGESLDPLFPHDALAGLGKIAQTVFLGTADGAPRFAVAAAASLFEGYKDHPEFVQSDLRAVAVQAMVAAEHLPPLAEAKSLLLWHARGTYCSNCGTPMRTLDAGWRRDCPQCKAQHFPRTDPVVIMLAIDGDHCLLGRSGRFTAKSWSCLAGFVEPGETIEDAVRREILEETGVRCGEVQYFRSQPWPFPSSLMIGCHTRALTRDLVVDHNELEAARWFHRDEVASMLARTHPDGLLTPVPVAIAYHIVRHWVERGVAFA